MKLAGRFRGSEAQRLRGAAAHCLNRTRGLHGATCRHTTLASSAAASIAAAQANRESHTLLTTACVSASPVVMCAAVDSRRVLTSFRLQGLSLQQGVLPLILSYIAQHNKRATAVAQSGQSQQAATAVLLELISRVQQQLAQQTSSLVDADTVRSAIASLAQKAGSTRTELITHAAALSRALFHFDSHQRRFVALPASQPLHAPVACKTALFRDRFSLIRQRVLAHPLLAATNAAYRVSYIEGLPGTRDKHTVLATLAIGSDGRMRLEDDTGSVRLLLDERVEWGDGFYTEGGTVLAEGHMDTADDEAFRCHSLMQPPIERREVTLQRHRELRTVDEDEEARLSSLLSVRDTDMIVVMSDCHLDQPVVVSRLHTVFKAFDEGQPPAIVVLAGPFLSSSRAASTTSAHPPTSAASTLSSSSASSLLSTHFAMLGDVIASYSQLNAHTQFVLLPSAADCVFGGVLPLPPLLSASHSLSTKVKHLVLAANPHHIHYYGKHIVLHRQALMHTMTRHALLQTRGDDEQQPVQQPGEAAGTAGAAVQSDHRHLLCTLLSQSHLSPLTLDAQPVYWSYDSSLSLYPLPHVLLLLDERCEFEVEYDGCLAIGGRSLASRGEFIVYYPASNTCEPSKVPG